MKSINSLIAGIIVISSIVFSPGAYCATVAEVQLSNNDKKLLDPFEKHSLDKADKLFDAKQYKAAIAEYDAFTLEFPNSSVMPYVLLRKARSIHLDNKRYNAIKAYQDVLDYFPNSVDYAAPALYYMGRCHWDNGDPKNAIRAWTKMADDPAYSKNYLASNALNMLASNFAKQKEWDKAMKYYAQSAVQFRRSNPDIARNAMNTVINYYFKTQPNTGKLRSFFADVQGFSHHPTKLPNDEVALDKEYWKYVIANLPRYGSQFNNLQEKDKKEFYGYWSEQMGDRYKDWPYFKVAAIETEFQSEGDEKDKFKALDKVYDEAVKANDFGTIINVISHCNGKTDKLDDYYKKIDFSKLNNDLKIKLMFALLKQKKYPMAQNVFGKIDLADMTDQERYSLMRNLWNDCRAGFPEECLVTISESANDLDYGRRQLFEYYYNYKSSKEALPLANQLRQNPSYASDVLYRMGLIYYREKKYEDAIRSYHEADNPPSNLFQIIECYARMGRLSKAVDTCSQIEGFFKDHAAQASLRKAYLYRDAKLTDKYKAALRIVLKKYPKSSQSGTAHEELEKMGERIGGAVDNK